MTDSTGICKADIRHQVAQSLGQPADAIADTDDLIAAGLDSIRMMKLAGGWRKRGFDVNFAQLAAAPSVEQWYLALTGGDTAPPPTPTDVADVEPDTENEPFPLAPMQHAYWIGRADSQDLGGVAAHLYVEFDGAHVDVEALERAVKRLVAVHPMLRARFLPDGTQQILPAPALPAFAVVDLRSETAEGVEERLAALRDEKTHQRMRVETGQVIDVTLTRLPYGRARLHVDIDMLAADAMSYRVVMADLAKLYGGIDVEPAAYTYRRYRTEHRLADPAENARDREWWQQRL
ncbi:MAG: non-ribosomal peptide synthetase, partial [Aldersonia sp.]|nr:non-ribosomal peptide synthetase [Aldersonia sp.]